MMYFSKHNILLAVLQFLLFATSCNVSPTNEMNKLDIETLDFDMSIDSLLQLGKYIRMDTSSITSSLMYYSYDVDTFGLGVVSLTGTSIKEFKHGKPDQLDDVFDEQETINRIEFYPSPNSTLDALSLEINNRDEAKALLKHLGNKVNSDFNIWADESTKKTYILRKQEWVIDKTKMLTINFCIIRSNARVGDESLVSLFKEYYDYTSY